MAIKINKSRLTVPKARTGWPNNVCHREASVFFIDGGGCDWGGCKLAPPGQHPGPTWAAEESANYGEHCEFEKEPGHDPVGKWFGGQITPESRRRLRRTLGGQHHEAHYDQGRNQRHQDIKPQ